MAASCHSVPLIDGLSLITSLFSRRALSDHSNFHSNVKIHSRQQAIKRLVVSVCCPKCARCSNLHSRVHGCFTLFKPSYSPLITHASHLDEMSPLLSVWECLFCSSIQPVWRHICNRASSASRYYPHSLAFLWHWFTGDFQNLRGQCSTLSVSLRTHLESLCRRDLYPRESAN